MKIFSRLHITTRLLIINIFILLIFCSVVGVVFVSFEKIEDFMATVVEKDVVLIVHNARISRDISLIIKNVSTVINDFLEQEGLLETAGQRLAREAADLAAQNENTVLGTSLEKFSGNIGGLVEQGKTIADMSHEIRFLENNMVSNTKELEDLITKIVVIMMMEGRDISRLERLKSDIPWYLEKILNVKSLVKHLSQVHLSTAAEGQKDKELLGHILMTIDELEVRIHPITKSEPEIVKLGKQFTENVRRYKEQVVSYEDNLDIFQLKLIALYKSQENLLQVMEDSDKELARKTGDLQKLVHQKVSASKKIILFLAIAIFIILVAMTCFVSKMILPLKKIIDALTRNYQNVLSASHQVASASQSLAERSTEQAASTEQISSSLEEVSSMSRQNADNADHADNLMKTAEEVIRNANRFMGDLSQSMAEITKTSEETDKIIKTIDEIAFQTNLLALNAAIEAARAGRAGAGFAVVSEEVRSLAMRTSEAARTTSELIKGVVNRVRGGSDLAQQAGNASSEVVRIAVRVGELVGEITAASGEQAHGIEQVNRGVSEIGKVTSQNVSGTEELAAASDKMNSQAKQMRQFVSQLTALIGQNGSNGRKSPSPFRKIQDFTGNGTDFLKSITAIRTPKR
ncbi:Putative methyl-accepting chemotaxis sensory tra nsducer [Desulfonema ishimotonii]|uniref:Methyl-accepting chemotaxis sensory tra nsducer n=1 Tax=Desulfonema ishimotonii TaxID=45657 RepID=A0A401FVC1_9BACT|nr:methyl-accepting chemotaxis protein [Desulfonema ishimotonii]GBC60903.1 Putative methyl-accepting chemotaxis sensory tra nsducer [Desulfonema ishimotonii]